MSLLTVVERDISSTARQVRRVSTRECFPGRFWTWILRFRYSNSSSEMVFSNIDYYSLS